MECPDFAFYRDEWRGRLDEDSFTAALTPARVAVAALVGWNDARTDRQRNCLRRAVCAAADAAAESGCGLSSVKVGSFSASIDAEAAERAVRDAARAELLAGGLLWGGCR